MYSPTKKYRDIHKNLVEEDLLCISSPYTTKFDVSFIQWMQNLIKVACTSGPFFEKIIKRYPIFSLQKNYYQIDQKHR